MIYVLCGVTALILLIILAIYLIVFRWSVSVPDYMAARHYRFGKPKSEKPISGRRVLVIPTIDHLIMIDQRIQKSTLENISVLTKERQVMKVSSTIIWKTQDAAMTIENIKPEEIEPTFFKIIESVIKNESSKMTVDEILENRSQLAKNLNVVLKETTDTWGLIISSVNISNLTVANDNFMKNMALPKEIENERKAKLAQIEKDLTIELKNIEKDTESKLAALKAEKTVGEEKEKVTVILEKAEKERIRGIQLLQKEIEKINAEIEKVKSSCSTENESQRIKAVSEYSESGLNYEMIKVLPEIYKHIKMGDVTLFQNNTKDDGFNTYSNFASSLLTLLPHKHSSVQDNED